MEIYSVMAYTLNINDKAYNILSSGFSLKTVVGAEGKHRSSSCSVSVKGEDVLSSLMYAEDYLDAIVKDEAGNVLFTGVIRPYSTVSVLQTTLDAINIEILDYTEKLHIQVYEAPTEDADRKDGIVYSANWDGLKVCDPSDTSNSLVHKLCSLVGINSIEAPTISMVIYRYSLNDGDYVDEKLSDLLYEYIHDYRFDEQGKMIVFQSGPIITGSDNEGNAVFSDLVSSGMIQTIYNSLDIVRNDDKKDGVIVKYGKYATKENVRLFTETRSGWSPVIDIRLGWWSANKRKITWDKTPLNEINAKDVILSNWWIEFKNESWGLGTTKLASKSLSDCTQTEGIASWSIDAYGGALFNTIKARISIYADASYLLDEQGTCGIEGTNTESYTASYLFSLEKASSLASAIYARGKRAQFTYTFKSKDDLTPGCIYDLEELSVSGLSTTVRILMKEQSDVSGVYKYTAEGYGNISFTEPTFAQEREEAKWDAMDMLELQLSKDEVVLKNDDPVEALASGLLIQKYGETPSWYLNNSPLNETSVNLSITKDQLRIGPNILKVEIEHEEKTYKLERKISYITADDVVKIEFTVCEEDKEPDENSVWVTYQPVYVKGQVVWVRIMTVASDDWIILRWTGIDGSDGVGISSVVREYAVSSSNSSAPNGGWDEPYPARNPGEYVWVRDKYTYTNGTVAVTVPYVCSGLDGKVLSMSADTTTFRLKSDGTPYPDQVATVTVNKQGIEADTEFEATNGMEIEANSSEFKVTPYSAGIAKFKLKNLVPETAITYEKTRTLPTSLDYIDALQYDVFDFYGTEKKNHRLYVRCTYWANRNRQDGEVFLNFNMAPGNYTIDDAPEISTTKATVSKVFIIPENMTEISSNRIGYYVNIEIGSLKADITCYRDNTMLIDLTELEEAFPYFASLSDVEKKEILDTLPFFEDEFIICNTLHNLVPVDKQAKEVTAIEGTKNYINCFVAPINAPSSDDMYYARADLKFSRATESIEYPFFNFDRPINKSTFSESTSASNLVNDYLERSRFWRFGKIGPNYGENVFGLFYNTPSYTLTADITFGFENGLLIDITKDGWDIWLRLTRNISPQDISGFFNSLPFFEDTYDVPISPLTITATAGDFIDKLAFGYVQDGQNGQDGADGQDGQDGADGEDAKLLQLSSDIRTFTSESQVATIKVNKQGISEQTELTASNGMKIEADSTEIKVTPYSAGFEKFKCFNFATNTMKGKTVYGGITFSKTIVENITIDSEGNVIGNDVVVSNTYTTIHPASLNITDSSYDKYIRNNTFLVMCEITDFTHSSASNPYFSVFFERAYIKKSDGKTGYKQWRASLKNPATDGNNAYHTHYFVPEDTDYKEPNDFERWIGSNINLFLRFSSFSNDETFSFKMSKIKYIFFDTPLEDLFPQFSLLNAEEKVEVLRTFPNKKGEIIIGDKLRNFKRPIDPTDGHTCFNCQYLEGTSNEYERSDYRNMAGFEFSRVEVWNLYDDYQKNYKRRCNYGRLRVFKNETSLRFSFDGGLFENVPAGETGTFSAFRYQENENLYGCYVYFGYGQDKNAPHGIIGIDPDSLLFINLTETGWHTYFKLIGATDQAIKDWADSLPYFETEYEPQITELTITADAGDYTDTLTLNYSKAVQNLEIKADPTFYNMTSRKYVNNAQVISLTCLKTNYGGTYKPIWTISDVANISFTDETGSEVIEGTTYEGDRAFVLVNVGCRATSFKVTCSLVGLGTREMVVAGSFAKAKAEYLGTVDATLGQTFPTSMSEGPIMVGDMVVYITQDSQGTKKSEYYVCTNVNSEGVGTWITNTIIGNNNSGLMISGIYDAIINNSTNADLLRMVKQLVAQYIAAEYIEITGAIYGGSYKIDGTPITDSNGKQGKGFYLTKDGIAKFYEAEINGALTATDDDGIIMQTKKTAVSKPYTESNIDRYLVAYYWAENEYTNPVAYIQKEGNSTFYFRKGSSSKNYAMDFNEFFEGTISTDTTPIYGYGKDLYGKPIIAWSEYAQYNSGSLSKTITVKGNFTNVDAYCYVKPVWTSQYPVDDVNTVVPSLKVNGTEKINVYSTNYFNVGTNYYGNKVCYISKLSLKENDTISIQINNSINNLALTVGIVYLSKYRMPYCKLLLPDEDFSNIVEYQAKPVDENIGGTIENFTSFNPVYKLLNGDNFQIANGGCFVRITDSDLHVYNNSGTDLGSVTSPTQAMCDLGIVYTSLYNMLSELAEGEYNTNEDTSYFKINNSYDFTDVNKISVSSVSDSSKSIIVYGHNSKNKPTEITSGTFYLRQGLIGSTIALTMSAIFSLQILSQLRGLYVASLQPSRDNNDNVVDIGMTNNHFDNAYIDNMHGNVNSEDTRETYDVWGAVAN